MTGGIGLHLVATNRQRQPEGKTALAPPRGAGLLGGAGDFSLDWQASGLGSVHSPAAAGWPDFSPVKLTMRQRKRQRTRFRTRLKVQLELL
jgi:hypothetical protein